MRESEKKLIADIAEILQEDNPDRNCHSLANKLVMSIKHLARPGSNLRPLNTSPVPGKIIPFPIKEPRK
jgi:hypothetical protein